MVVSRCCRGCELGENLRFVHTHYMSSADPPHWNSSHCCNKRLISTLSLGNNGPTYCKKSQTQSHNQYGSAAELHNVIYHHSCASFFSRRPSVFMCVYLITLLSSSCTKGGTKNTQSIKFEGAWLSSSIILMKTSLRLAKWGHLMRHKCDLSYFSLTAISSSFSHSIFLSPQREISQK